jgi:hypothetical protein
MVLLFGPAEDAPDEMPAAKFSRRASPGCAAPALRGSVVVAFERDEPLFVIEHDHAHEARELADFESRFARCFALAGHAGGRDAPRDDGAGNAPAVRSHVWQRGRQ